MVTNSFNFKTSVELNSVEYFLYLIVVKVG